MNPMEKFLGKVAGKPAETEVSSSPLSFSMPPGFKVPDGVKDGESFDAMATLMVRDGKLVLGELDGAPIGDEPEMAPEPEMAEKPESEESEYSKDEAEDEIEDAPKDEIEDDSASDEDEGLGFLDRIEKKITKKKKM